MKQCIQALDRLGVPTSLPQQQVMRHGAGHGSDSASGVAVHSGQDAGPRSSAAKNTGSDRAQSLAHIAPRPCSESAQGGEADHGDPRQAGMGKAPKKRGRPSKADMAKRDLKPNLPQLIAPRPPAQHVAGFQPILPAAQRPCGAAREASPAATSATSQSTPSVDSRTKKRRRAANAAT